MNIRLDRVLVSGIIVVVTMFIVSYISTAYLTGVWVYLPIIWIAGLVVLAVSKWKSIMKWIGMLSVLFAFTSCNYVAPEEVGVWVKNYGRTENDYKIVSGSYPYDFTRSTWILTFAGKPFPVEVNSFEVASKNGVTFQVDPSVLCVLTRTNEAARKYAFKLSAYKGDIESGLQTILLKEVLDVVRTTLGNAQGDTIAVNQIRYSNIAQDKLKKVLNDVYGIELMQFSMSIVPPQELKNSINASLIATQTAKTEIAKNEIEKALVEREKIMAEKSKIQQVALTPAMLRKMELETMERIYDKLSKSPNKVIVVGNPEKIILNN